jgi:hypothetical protein
MARAVQSRPHRTDDSDPKNRRATIVADLAADDALAADTFDCFLTQTLQYIFDLEVAVAHYYRILAPGDVLLCTVPSVNRLSRRCSET